jgi:hypothetical protein
MLVTSNMVAVLLRTPDRELALLLQSPGGPWVEPFDEETHEEKESKRPQGGRQLGPQECLSACHGVERATPRESRARDRPGARYGFATVTPENRHTALPL